MDKMDKNELKAISKKLDEMSKLMLQLAAIQLYRGGATQPEVAENLGISLGSVNKLVKGIKNLKVEHGKE